MSATDTLSPTPSTTRTVMPLPHVDFLYLSEADMIAAGVTDMHQCVDTMEEMFALFAAGDYRMTGESNDSHGAMMTFPETSPFPNMPVPTEDRRFMAMPAYLGGDFQTTGVKWYGSNIANREKGLPRSILMFTLNDTDTGAPFAFMSANLLSAYRTGAVPGVGAWALLVLLVSIPAERVWRVRGDRAGRRSATDGRDQAVERRFASGHKPLGSLLALNLLDLLRIVAGLGDCPQILYFVFRCLDDDGAHRVVACTTRAAGDLMELAGLQMPCADAVVLGI